MKKFFFLLQCLEEAFGDNDDAANIKNEFYFG